MSLFRNFQGDAIELVHPISVFSESADCRWILSATRHLAIGYSDRGQSAEYQTFWILKIGQTVAKLQPFKDFHIIKVIRLYMRQITAIFLDPPALRYRTCIWWKSINPQTTERGPCGPCNFLIGASKVNIGLPEPAFHLILHNTEPLSCIKMSLSSNNLMRHGLHQAFSNETFEIWMSRSLHVSPLPEHCCKLYHSILMV